MVVLDVDGTLTPHISVWQFIHERLGLWTGRADRYWDRYRRGEIDYAEFCALDASLWRGQELAALQLIADELPYNPGVPAGLRRLRALGLPVALLSTGLKLLTDRIRNEFDLQWSFSNGLVVADGRLTGEAEVLVQDGAKGETLAALVADLGVDPRSIVAVGDSYNDVDVARRVGWFVAHRCQNAELARIADHVTDGDDFADVVDRIEAWCDGSPGTGGG
jgi:phosphoserine phosphatase